MSKKDLDDSGVGIIAQEIGSLDLGYGAVPPDYSSVGYGADTITLDPSLMTSSITLPSSSVWTTGTSNTNYTIGSASSSYYNTTTSGYTISNTPASVNISTDGIEMAAGTDIKVDGKSLKEFMNKMEERLAILVPDPKKLEQFAALKKAYEHYKLMEKLCQEPPKEED
jgi:hypothetical protein